MYSLTISRDDSFLTLDASSSYLCLINVESVPPHISLICQGGYFSYSVFGLKMGTNAQARVDAFSKRGLPCVFINIGDLILFEEALEKYAQLNPLQPNSSCLLPIVELLKNKGLIPKNDPLFIFNVIEWLQVNNKITKIESIGCQHLISNNQIQLSTYGQQEIDKQINLLKIK